MLWVLREGAQLLNAVWQHSPGAALVQEFRESRFPLFLLVIGNLFSVHIILIENSLQLSIWCSSISQSTSQN